MEGAQVALLIGILAIAVQIIVFVWLKLKSLNQRKAQCMADLSEPMREWQPDPDIAAVSESAWEELCRMPHMVSLIEERALVDIVHHVRLYWRCEDGLCLITLKTDDDHWISLAGTSAVSKLLNCHRAIAARTSAAQHTGA